MGTPAITDEERRARLVARHHLGRTAADPVEAVRGVVALHSSDPATPYLGTWARVEGFDTQDLDRALLEERTLWRLHAMRRTLFVVPTDAAPVFEAAAGRDVAAKERARLRGWLADVMPEPEVEPFLEELTVRTLAELADRGTAGTQELGDAVPGLRTDITVGSGRWTTTVPVSSRLLFVLAMEGMIVRTATSGSWRSSQYAWASVPAWFGTPLERRDPVEARADLLRRYLASHGPATTVDVRWWAGWTAARAKAALAAVEAVPVELDGGGEAWVLADDTRPAGPPEPSVSLLPGLDPTPMGWKERDWYLGPHGPALYDRSGNLGPSIWVDGRIVGGWAQRADGQVVHRLLEDLGAERSEAVAQRAAELTAWLGEDVVVPRFRTPLERQLTSV